MIPRCLGIVQTQRAEQGDKPILVPTPQLPVRTPAHRTRDWSDVQQSGTGAVCDHDIEYVDIEYVLQHRRIGIRAAQSNLIDEWASVKKTPTHRSRMRLLKVAQGGLSFGCVRAKDLRGNDVVIVVYESVRSPHATRVPLAGELVLCEHAHASVFHPRAVVDERHLCLRRLDLPSDLTLTYFPLFERIRLA